METKEQQRYYLIVKGQKVEVSEEVYRAYVRPISAEKRKNLRNSRCLVKGERFGLVRCKEDCQKCPFYCAGNKLMGGILSLDSLVDAGYEQSSDVDLEDDVISDEEHNARLGTLHEAIAQLNERQKYLIEEIYFKERTCEDIAAELGVDGSAVRHALKRIRASIRKFFRENQKNFS